jgi:UDP-glucose 4-epimerase
MSRVLITGGAGPLGAAVSKRLLADPDYDVRISDPRPAPRWMREGCEIHRGDLRTASHALAAVKGCAHVIHVASFDQGTEQAPHALLEHEAALHNAVLRAAIQHEVQRFVFLSSSRVFERAEQFPTPEDHLEHCPPPRSARGFARLGGERLCAAAYEEHGLEYAICRPFDPYAPDAALALGDLLQRAARAESPLAISGAPERTLTPTHVEDLAGGVLAALVSPTAANQDFNLGASRELSLAEIARLAWEAAGGEPRALQVEHRPAREAEPQRSHPSVQKARELLGWEAQIDAPEGIAAAAIAVRERASAEPTPVPAGG